MKNLTVLSICFIAVVNLFGSSDSTQTADQYLKDDNQRKEVLIAQKNTQ